MPAAGHTPDSRLVTAVTRPSAGSGLNRNPLEEGPGVQQAITDHQRTNAAWRYRQVIDELHLWRDRYERAFALELPPIAACIGWTRKLCYGYFRPGPNWFGFEREILLHEGHLVGQIEEGEGWRVLETWLHELLHAWQFAHSTPGRNNYHNVEYQRRAAACGLAVDGRGITEAVPGGPFFQLLAEFGPPRFELPAGVALRPAATKLKKWVCRCQPAYGVRVAIDDFRAVCLKCHEPFAPAGR